MKAEKSRGESPSLGTNDAVEAVTGAADAAADAAQDGWFSKANLLKKRDE